MVADLYLRQMTVFLVSRDARPREGVFALYTKGGRSRLSLELFKFFACIITCVIVGNRSAKRQCLLLLLDDNFTP